MSQFARVDSIDALRAFRASLWEFAAEVASSIDDAESDLQRTFTWLGTEQTAYWRGQLRKRTELLARAKQALRNKQMYKSPSGGKSSTVEEERAVALAQRRLEEAQEKTVAIKKWLGALPREKLTYQGQVQRLRGVVEHGVPHAVARLERMIDSLEAYVALTPDEAPRPVGDEPAAGGMAQPTSQAGDSLAGADESEQPDAERGESDTDEAVER